MYLFFRAWDFFRPACRNGKAFFSEVRLGELFPKKKSSGIIQYT